MNTKLVIGATAVSLTVVAIQGNAREIVTDAQMFETTPSVTLVKPVSYTSAWLMLERIRSWFTSKHSS